MKALVWLVAAAAVALAYLQFNWKGVLLVVTVVIFWQLMTFNRALRTLRAANDHPVGYIDSAVMLNARLQRGMTMLKIVGITRSLGRQLSERPDVWTWVDPGGAAVVLTLENGKVTTWELTRPATPPMETPPIESNALE